MVKRNINIIKYLVALLAVLVISILPSTAFADSAKFEEGTVISDNINMRLRPSLDSPVVCQIDEGARIGIYCEYEDDWIRVIYGNYRGYIKRNLVFLPSEDQFQGNVYGDELRLRKSPGDYSTILSELEVGTPVTIEDINGEWYYVSVNGDDMEGYVAKEYVQMSDSDVAAFTLKPGMTGSAVYNMQKELKKRNFYAYPCTGVYGDATKLAVRNFQRVAGLKKDGIAGEETLELLYSEEDIRLEGSAAAGSGGIVLKSDWYSVVNDRFLLQSTATVIDIKTMKRYNVIRYAGENHADCTPATKADTKIMLETYGGEWSWDRRPVWVIINGVMYAASTNGMPHGTDYNRTDGMDGQICIHFLNSRDHWSDAVDEEHQQCIEYAYRISQY